MPSIDEILASSPLADLRRVSASGGDRQVAQVRLAESFTDLDQAPAESLGILSRSPSAEGLSDAALRCAANGGSGTGGRGSWPDGRPADEVIAPVVVGETPEGYLVAPEAHGDFGVAVRLVLHTAALAAGRLLDLARRAHETPVRSRSELLAELLMSDNAINEDLLERARALVIPVTGWHVVVRIEADDLGESGR